MREVYIVDAVRTPVGRMGGTLKNTQAHEMGGLVCKALMERTGREAVRQWFDLMLRQQPDRVPIYRTEAGAAGIGVDRQMIGSKLPSGLIAAEIERNVRETASYCPAVRAVRDFEVTRQGRRCHVAFTAVLYDAETVEVSADV